MWTLNVKQKTQTDADTRDNQRDDDECPLREQVIVQHVVDRVGQVETSVRVRRLNESAVRGFCRGGRTVCGVSSMFSIVRDITLTCWRIPDDRIEPGNMIQLVT